MKPGLKSSELWVTVAWIASITVLVAMDKPIPTELLTWGSILVGVYTGGRSLAKGLAK